MANCAQPLNCSEVYGTLTIGGVSLHGPAWCAHDLSDLFTTPEYRGENPMVETLPGRPARPVVDEETDYQVPLMFSGATDQAGTPHADAYEGLQTNRRTFLATFVDPIRTGTAELAATLTEPGGFTFTGGVQPLDLGWTLLPNGYARSVLTLRVPRGRLLSA